MPAGVKVWLSSCELATAAEFARSKLPLESGGLLLGFWVNANECVINGITTSGPNATHKAYTYTPDYEHDAEIARRAYASSTGKQNYLGDWHSHPHTRRPYLSLKDRFALRGITATTSLNERPGLSLVMALDVDEKSLRYRLWFGLPISFLKLPIPAAFRCHICEF